MNKAHHDKIISASDVEKFGYCPLSWWLSEQNATENADELRIGSKNHALIGKDVKNIEQKEKLSKESERNILWFSLIAIVIGINGLAIIYPVYAPSYQGKAIMTLLSVIAILWVIVAVYFFYTGMKREVVLKRLMDGPADPHNEKRISIFHSPFEPHVDWRKRFFEAKWNMLLFFFASAFLATHGFIILFRLGEVHSLIISQIFLILSLLWLVASSFFYYLSLRREIVKKEGKEMEEIKNKPSFTDSEISIALFAVVATVLASNSFTIYQNPDTNIGRIFLIVTVLWLYGGFIFLYIALRANMRLKLLFSEELKVVDAKKSIPQIYNKPGLKFKLEEGTLDYERGVIWFAAIAMILALNAIIMNFSESLEELYGTLIAHIFEIVALIWLLGASFFLYMVLRYSQILTKLRDQHGIEDSTIEYVDAPDKDSKILYSERLGLRGRPDYVLKKNGDLVPVEVKTGRTPRGPLFSHILQLAAYCLLVEDNYKKPPPYGIIKYSGAQHKIEYNDELKNTLSSKLDEMKKIIESGEAHRNHNRLAKCKGCSRREECPEKLV